MRITLLLLLCSFPAWSEQKLPNILIFLVDDMGLMDTSVPFLTDKKGDPKKHSFNEFYRTPGMERLAKSGVRFSRFYANSVCSPTRISLLTGQSSARHKTTQYIKPEVKNGGPEKWNWDGLSKHSVTLPRLLASKGYHTIHCGKAHLGPIGKEGADPKNVGFIENIAGRSIGAPGSYYGESNYGSGGKRAVPGLKKYHGTNTFLSEALTLEVNQAIDTSVKKNKDKPLFIHMSHYAVHAPFNVDHRFIQNYEKTNKSKKHQAFATLIEGMDKSLNDMLNHLEKIGEAEETLVIFLGDNGTDAPAGKSHDISCSAPLRGKKGTHYEGGMRAPLIIAWAKQNPESAMQKKFPIKGGLVSNTFATIYDIMPTVLNIADASSPKEHVIDGHDLKNMISGQVDEHPQKFLMHFPHSHRSSHYTVYIEEYKKIIYHYKSKRSAQRIEFFDLKADPVEENNLSESHKDETKILISSMLKELNAAKAQYNLDSNGKEIKPVIP